MIKNFTDDIQDVIFNHIGEEEVAKMCWEKLEPMIKKELEKAFDAARENHSVPVGFGFDDYEDTYTRFEDYYKTIK